MIFCRLQIFFKIKFFKKIPSDTIRESNRLDPDQAQHSVGPDLGPICLRRASEDDNI